MEKLLKLINEYEEEGIIFDEVDDEECFVDIHPCTLWTEYEGHLWFNNANKVQFDKWMFDRVAISKEYGFIKWLVDNDKIDRLTFCTVETPSSKYEDFDLGPETPREDYTNILLMDLALQEKPIEFLISILRER